ncbi:MAG: glycosyltransferase family 4 protein [Anaerolineae bacterium]
MRVLFVHSGNEQFVKIDRDLLSATFTVQDLYVPHKFPLGLLRYLRGVAGCDVVFCWFASWNTFWALLFARLFHKPALLVVGGYDVANLPEAHYGHQRGGVGKLVSLWAMRLATLLLPFSAYSQQEVETRCGIPQERTRLVYLGVPDRIGELSQVPKERMALTVGNVDWSNLKRKGLEPFIRAAAFLPDVQFVLVGRWADDSINYLKSIASPNVTFTGRVSDEELQRYYRHASVYVQASLHEGFGMSVAEAMLAGCIPVTTRAGALPEVVGECGIYTDSVDSAVLSKSIRAALALSQEVRQWSRQRVLTMFTKEKRSMLLQHAVQSSCSHKNG